MRIHFLARLFGIALPLCWNQSAALAERSCGEGTTRALRKTLISALKEEDRCYLEGVGTFYVQTRRAYRRRTRKGANYIEIPEKRYIRFRPTLEFEAAVIVEREAPLDD